MVQIHLLAQETLKESGTPWDYLQFNDFLGDPIDPARVDEGFRTTWMDSDTFLPGPAAPTPNSISPDP